MNIKTIIEQTNNKKMRRFCYGIKSYWDDARRRIREGFKVWSEKEAEGYTYVETVAVIAIGAILTTGAVFSANKVISIARKTAAKSQIEQFSSALQTYFLDCGRFCRKHGVTIRELLERGVHCGVIWQNGEDFFWPDSIRLNVALPKSRLIEAMERLRKHVFL